MANGRYGAILAADFGNVHTRLVLLDTVDGSYRLVARVMERTTADFPFSDVSVGLARATARMSQITGRKMLDAGQRVIVPEQGGAGVDSFLATASSGRPLRTVLVGLVPEISITSVRRASAGAYVEIVETLSLDDSRSEEEQVNAIISANPDLVLIAGGTEGGAQEPVLGLARVIAFMLRLLEIPRRPVIIYAGNSALAPQMRTLFSSLTTLFIAPNVRPTLDDEDLDGAQLQLGMAFDAFKENRGDGFDIVSDMSALGVLPTAQSYNLVTEYLGKAADNPVLAVDVGSAVGTLAAYLHEQVNTVIRTDIGLGHSAYNLFELVGVDALREWLPFNAGYDELLAYARNKTLRPGTVPQSLKDLYFDHALLRAGLQALLKIARPTWYKSAHVALDDPLPPFDPIIGAGAGLTNTGNPGYAALLLLDAFQPQGITQLLLDPHGLIPALGSLAYHLPEAMVQVVDNGGLEELGTAICLTGQPRADRPALAIKVTAPDGTVTNHRLDGGHLWVYPLGAGQTADVDVRVLSRGGSLGGRGRIRRKMTGGTLGLIFDARGRPLHLDKDIRARALQMPQWIAETIGTAPHTIDESWLEPVRDSQPAEPEVQNGKKSRRGRRGQQDETDDRLKQLSPDSDDEEVSELDDLRNALR